MTFEEFKEKATKKTKDLYEAGKQKANDILDWTVENPEKAAIVGGILAYAGKSVSRMKKAKEEDDYRDRYIYNRSTGSYIKLRKPMTVRQQCEFDERKRNGESVTQILLSMRLI